MAVRAASRSMEIDMTNPADVAAHTPPAMPPQAGAALPPQAGVALPPQAGAALPPQAGAALPPVSQEGLASNIPDAGGTDLTPVAPAKEGLTAIVQGNKVTYVPQIGGGNEVVSSGRSYAAAVTAPPAAAQVQGSADDILRKHGVTASPKTEAAE